MPSVVARRETLTAALWGAITGAAAGLIGVGGGEFRIPVLLHLLRFQVRLAAGANCIIGLVVVIIGVFRRWGFHAWTSDALLVSAIMALVSLPGSAAGALLANKTRLRPLKNFVCAYLLLIGVWMVFEAMSQTEHVILNPTGAFRWTLAALLAFLIAGVSGALGVAGGEMRIPILLYLFGFAIQEAGTISLMVSIPTVAAGAITYRRLGHIPNHVLVVAVAMAAASIAGVIAGAAFLPLVNKYVLKAILGVILIAATVRLTAVAEA
jgi:uncharacterized protein